MLAKYEYDAWGNHKAYDGSGTVIYDSAAGIAGNNATHIGNVNPFRYKGYYYDTSIGLYYLNSRYYDAEIGRFINSDDIAELDFESINGLNLYNYCGNNPITRVDETGRGFWDWVKGIGSALMIAAGVVLCFIPGAQLAGAALIVTGAGGLIGGGISVATGGSFGAGWNVGTMVGGIIGLGMVLAPLIYSALPQIGSFLSQPLFGFG